MGQDVRWRPGRDDLTLFEREQAVGHLGHERNVVFDDDQARAHLVAQPGGAPVAVVEAVGGRDPVPADGIKTL